VEKITPFTPKVFVGRETHPSYVDFVCEFLYASQDDCMPATDSPGNDSTLKDILELIMKRLDNLETKIYFPSPEFEHSLRGNAKSEIDAAALIVARALESTENAFKLAIAAAVACKSVTVDNVEIAAMQSKNVNLLNENRLSTAGRDDAPQAGIATTPCPTLPECIRPYYDVRSSGQYPNISVPTCVTTTRIQNTKYPTTPFNWPRQPSFDDEHTNVYYNKFEQSPLYNTLATKNWTVVTTTWSNAQSTPVLARPIVEIDKPEKYPVYTLYPRPDPRVYALLVRKGEKY